MPSKLGPHINFVREADAMRDFLLTVRPAVALAIDPDAKFWAEIKAEAPEIFLIGRVVHRSQPWHDPEFAAGVIVNHLAAHIMDAWQGLNEPTREQLVDACALDIQVAEILHLHNIAYICGSWSVGVPDVEDWIRPEMLAVIRASDYIGIHAYNAPHLWDDRGVIWRMLRHRLWYDSLPDDCKKPVLITECGIDSGAVPWLQEPDHGWQHFTHAMEYQTELVWLDREIQLDNYIKGACWYQWGSLDHTWDSYGTTPELQRLLGEYIISQRDYEPPVPSPTPPPPDNNWRNRALIAEDQLDRIERITQE